MMKYGVFGFFLIGIIGCELAVDIDVPFKKQELTLSVLGNTDSVWTAKLNLNKHIMDDSYPFKTVDDAQINIYQGDQLIETLIGIGNGIYKAESAKPLVGETYEIRAESPTYGSVRATSSIPFSVALNAIEFGIPAMQHDNIPLTITINFTDRPSEKNYYQIIVYKSGTRIQTSMLNPSIIDTFQYHYHYPIYLYSINPSIGETDAYNSRDLIFSDALFENKSTSLEIRSDDYVGEKDTLTLSFRTLNEDLYRYYTTLKLQQQISGDPLAQPVAVYNNIQNGFGIFGGYGEYIYEYKK